MNMEIKYSFHYTKWLAETPTDVKIDEYGSYQHPESIEKERKGKKTIRKSNHL